MMSADELPPLAGAGVRVMAGSRQPARIAARIHLRVSESMMLKLER